MHPVDLSATVLTALAGRTGIDPGTVEDVIWRRSKAGLHMPKGATAALADYLARRVGALDLRPPADAEAR